MIDDDIELKTDVSTVDPLTAAAETAWLEYARGTYSNTDKRIFIEGFRRGDLYRQRQRLKELRHQRDYERRYSQGAKR